MHHLHRVAFFYSILGWMLMPSRQESPSQEVMTNQTNKRLLLTKTILGYFIEEGLCFLLCQDMLLDLAIIHSTLITPLYNLPI